MVDGEWQENGESIAVSRSGRLLNGQHRLLACIEAGVPFITLLAENVDDDAVITVDTGRARSFGDVLTMRGENRGKTLASIIKLSMMWGATGRGDNSQGSGRFTSNQQQLEFFERWPEVRDAAKVADRTKPKGLPSSVVGAFALNLIVAIDDQDFVDDFLRGVMNGEASQSSAAFSLWRQFAGWSAQASTKREASLYLALLVKCWNATVLDTVPQYWRWRRIGATAEPFPVILDMDGQPVSLCK